MFNVKGCHLVRRGTVAFGFERNVPSFCDRAYISSDRESRSTREKSCTTRGFGLQKKHHLPRATVHRGGVRPRTSDIKNTIRTYTSKCRDGGRVLIVGGGPTGLFLAHLLRSYDVPFRLLEAQTPDRRFRHPQAHFLNTRTMEILKHGLSHHSNSSNQSNEVYRKICDAMPPVEEWKTFRFVPTMTCSSWDSRMMAEVVHPVDRPLKAGVDANGKLTSSRGLEEGVSSKETEIVGGNFLSAESVGHLAQHTFCRILYEAIVQNPKDSSAVKSNDNLGDIRYGCRTTGFLWDNEARRWNVTTDQGDVFDDIDIIVAADGAASFTRKSLFSMDGSSASSDHDSTMLGTQTIQRLINVHFTVNDDRRIPPAMLYTVFNPDVLAMCVRHGPGEYVLQIPYFEPYQTPEDDFDTNKVHQMVRSILGDSDDFTIQSIRPWTMGSLVARKYYINDGVFLAGDAAHVFPPAGGFGMNTGLQDVFSLAWRIAHHRKRQQPTLDREDEPTWTPSLSTLGHSYQKERQPIARRNAALSVRNFNRVLNVMRACYLDDRHPALLIQALDATASFVPLETRRQTFRALLRTALSPLSQLQTAPTSMYARRIKSNLRSLLGSGQGLPLLFPKHEIDISYQHDTHNTPYSDEDDDWSQDSVASFPKLKSGGLFPHIVAYASLENLQRYPRLLILDNTDSPKLENSTGDDNDPNRSLRPVSTRDLASQLVRKEAECAFCLLHISPEKPPPSASKRSDYCLLSLQKSLEDKFVIPFLAAHLVICDMGKTNFKFDENEEGDPEICTFVVDKGHWESLDLLSDELQDSDFSLGLFVAIRPDGHVAAISSGDAPLEKLVLGIQSVVALQ